MWSMGVVGGTGTAHRATGTLVPSVGPDVGVWVAHIGVHVQAVVNQVLGVGVDTDPYKASNVVDMVVVLRYQYDITVIHGLSCYGSGWVVLYMVWVMVAP